MNPLLRRRPDRQGWEQKSEQPGGPRPPRPDETFTRQMGEIERRIGERAPNRT